MIFPKYLNSGDTIGIVAPAGYIDREKITGAAETISSNRFNVSFGKYLFGKHFNFSGHDGERLKDMQDMLDNPDISAILCARGGYGLIRIIEKLNFSEFLKKPKWIIGFSDISILHAYLNHYLDVASIHGPMCKMISEQPQSYSVRTLFNLLSGQNPEYMIGNSVISEVISGKIIGGNLSIICSLIGSALDFNPSNKILFIEDIGEYHYKIDRMMHHLRISGKLDGLKALVTGQFSGLRDKNTDFGESVIDIITRNVSNSGTPFFHSIPIGHEEENYPIILNANATIYSKNNQTYLKIEE